jgi:hypothetical protein
MKANTAAMPLVPTNAFSGKPLDLPGFHDDLPFLVDTWIKKMILWLES